MRLGPQVLPFADAATPELPLLRLLRLSLFQVTVGMAAVLLIGTLNRVMIVELAVPSWIVACMLALPLLFAPLRALIGYRSDNHRSVLGWRRVPFIWFGTMAQFGGFAIMPFALLILSGDTTGPALGRAGRGRAGVSARRAQVLHTVQTVGLALATDLAPERARPRVVALLCAMLLAGMAVSAVVFGLLLETFQRGSTDPGRAGRRGRDDGSQLRCALEAGAAHFDKGCLGAGACRPSATPGTPLRPTARTRRRLIATALGTAGFSMQDILLEPYGGKILHLPVGATTALTAMLALGGGGGPSARRAPPEPRRRPPSGRRTRACLSASSPSAASSSQRPLDSRPLFGLGVGFDRLWRRTLRARHVDGVDGAREARGPGPRPRRLGRGAVDGGRPRDRASAASSTISVRRLLRAEPSATRSRTR